MESVTRAVTRIQLVPRAHIDRSFRQGREAVVAQLRARTDDEVIDISVADIDIAHFREGINEICTWVAPNRLPEDYVFFLEFYGGLLIETPDYNLLVDGIGPMVEEWYGFPMGDDGICENGLLAVATLALKKERIGQSVRFFLDLAGTICQDCVIGIDDRGLERADYASILREPYAHTDRWTKLADSFTEWLEQAAATSGTFGYI
jgi:hypothetical protein